MTELQQNDRQNRINSWIDRAKVLTENGCSIYDELFDVRLTKDGEFVGYFDSKKEAIRYAERRLDIA